jgi:hypothetical protein
MDCYAGKSETTLLSCTAAWKAIFLEDAIATKFAKNLSCGPCSVSRFDEKVVPNFSEYSFKFETFM